MHTLGSRIVNNKNDSRHLRQQQEQQEQERSIASSQSSLSLSSEAGRAGSSSLSSVVKPKQPKHHPLISPRRSKVRENKAGLQVTFAPIENYLILLEDEDDEVQEEEPQEEEQQGSTKQQRGLENDPVQQQPSNGKRETTKNKVKSTDMRLFTQHKTGTTTSSHYYEDAKQHAHQQHPIGLSPRKKKMSTTTASVHASKQAGGQRKTTTSFLESKILKSLNNSFSHGFNHHSSYSSFIDDLDQEKDDLTHGMQLPLDRSGSDHSSNKDPMDTSTNSYKSSNSSFSTVGESSSGSRRQRSINVAMPSPTSVLDYPALSPSPRKTSTATPTTPTNATLTPTSSRRRYTTSSRPPSGSGGGTSTVGLGSRGFGSSGSSSTSSSTSRGGKCHAPPPASLRHAPLCGDSDHSTSSWTSNSNHSTTKNKSSRSTNMMNKSNDSPLPPLSNTSPQVKTGHRNSMTNLESSYSQSRLRSTANVVKKALPAGERARRVLAKTAPRKRSLHSASNNKNGDNNNGGVALAMQYQSNAFFWQDPRLQKSKVFSGKINGAAAKMQAIIRGKLQRKIYERMLIRKREQDRIDAKNSLEYRSAARIQAMIRGYLGRLYAQIQRLEYQLVLIQEKKKDDMRDIQRWRQQQMTEIQKMIDVELDKYCGMKAEARVNLDYIEELRKQNVALRERNTKLRADVDEVLEENQTLQAELDLIEEKTPIVRSKLNSLIHENTQWQNVHDLFEQRVTEYEAFVDRRDLTILLETTLHKRYQKTVRKMVTTFEQRSDDASVTLEVLEAMPHTLSERTVGPPSPRRKQKPKVKISAAA